jgi:hypothetical protein
VGVALAGQDDVWRSERGLALKICVHGKESMKRALYVLMLSMGLSIAARAEDWVGTLIDATCNDQREQEKTVSCDATSKTTAFALNVAGKIYKLDVGGNSKAVAAMKYRADPASDPSGNQSREVSAKQVSAKVTGTEAGGMILVETIGLQ